LPQTPLAQLTAHPHANPLAGIRGPASKGRGYKGKERGGRVKGEIREGNGKGVEGTPCVSLNFP